MKHQMFLFKVAPFVLIMLASTLLSFSSKPGGDSLEISVNDKLVLKQYVTRQTAVPNLSLDASANSLSVRYSHCGLTGQARTLKIKDGKENVLKEWSFKDGDKTVMVCKISEIDNLKKKETQGLALYYTSKEIPDGKQLANLLFADVNTVSKN